LVRLDIPTVKNTDNLGAVLDVFSKYDVSHLPVTIATRPKQVIGLISRAGLMRSYQQGLAEARG
jgi:CBS domain-containing protein